MGKILFLFLEINRFFQKILRKLRGRKEEDVYDERIISGRSWEEFCERLKLAGAVLKQPGAPRDALSQAEGIRYLSRLTRAGLEAYLEFNDPSFPVFRRTVHETIKMGADNPDNFYFNAQVSGNYEYRITGKRNTVHYLGFFTQNGNYGTTGGLAPCGALEHTEMQIDPDGSFEIILSKTPRGRNWLKIDQDTSLVMVRQTFLNRFEEFAAEFRIENLDGTKFPAQITSKYVDEGLKSASLLVAGAPLLFARWANGFRKHTNQLPQFDQAVSNAMGGDSGIIYYHSHWKLKDDEALIIEVVPPECDSWNFQLNNYWMESLDYRYHTICVNKATAVYNDDASVRIIVSHQDPGRTNWIETCGHHEGTMLWRWYRLKPGELPVQPECKVIKFSEL